MMHTTRSVLLAFVACLSSAAHANDAPAARPVAKLVKQGEAATLSPLPADESQMEAARHVYQGIYACEFDQTLEVTPHAEHMGYIDVKWKNRTFTMAPRLSSTGAVRLVDVSGRVLMIQIASKSMLLDTKAGQRLVDDCQSEEQRVAAAAAAMARANGTAAMGLGIAPR